LNKFIKMSNVESRTNLMSRCHHKEYLTDGTMFGTNKKTMLVWIVVHKIGNNPVYHGRRTGLVNR
jgi:hypothetical protein